MPKLQSIFILGATGYVGGSLLVALAKAYPSVTLSALVRNTKDADAVAAVGTSVRVISGSHADLDLITTESSNADVVFQVSDPDDLALTQAIVAGLKIHKEKTGIRTGSGTATIKDDADGELTEDYPFWDDTDVKALKSIDVNAPHRIVDLEAIKAHNEEVADVYVICPATIYGVGTGPVRRTSMQIPKVVEIFLDTRRVEYISKGTNVWSNIHVQDLANVFLLILTHALRTQNAGESARPQDGFNNFYFAIADEHTWGPVISRIGQLMYQKGLLDTPEAHSVDTTDAPILALYTGSNSRAFSTRLKALGWRPEEKSIHETVQDDVDLSVELFTARI